MPPLLSPILTLSFSFSFSVLPFFNCDAKACCNKILRVDITQGGVGSTLQHGSDPKARAKRGLQSKIKHVFRLTKPKKAFVSSRYMARLSKAGIGSHNNITTDGNVFGFGGVESIESVMVDETTAKEAMPYVPSDIKNTAYLPFSSGTTGMPKAVEISHSNVISMVEIFCKTPSLFPKNEDRSEMQFRTLNFLPFSHTYALILMLHYPIRKRGHTSILRPFKPDTFCRLIKELKPNFLALVPPVLTLLMKHPAVTPEAFSSVKQTLCGAAPLDFRTQSAFIKKTGVPVQQASGMMETTVVCKGNYGNPEATRDNFADDGYLRTGDIAVVDPRIGEFSIVNRLKELIKYKGFQVASAELKGVLVTHPAVAAAAAVGMHDKEQGTELPLAFVELKIADGQQKKEEAIRDIDSYVRAKVSHHKYLCGGIQIPDKVPVSANGKILRKEICKLLQAEIKAKEATPKAKLRGTPA
ncbi:hypothetical protein NDA13_001616 [Ustilago tritici]|nr:hypothetical protein NDA13_001616 [Ustilago tritici]